MPKTKTQIGAYVDNEVLSDAKDAVVYLQTAGAETPVNLSELITQALRREVDRSAAKHHVGKPFPARAVELQPARRPSADSRISLAVPSRSRPPDRRRRPTRKRRHQP